MHASILEGAFPPSEVWPSVDSLAVKSIIFELSLVFVTVCVQVEAVSVSETIFERANVPVESFNRLVIQLHVVFPLAKGVASTLPNHLTMTTCEASFDVALIDASRGVVEDAVASLQTLFSEVT